MISNVIRGAAFPTKKIRPIFQSFARYKAAYEGDGKTTVRILNQETDLGLMIDSISTFGFRLNNGVTVLGPMMLFPRTVLSWQIGGVQDITADSLRLLTILEPRIDLLVVGVENGGKNVQEAARSLGLNVEVLEQERAAASFNFLNAEGRNVCAAMLPPTTLTLSHDDMLHSQLHYRNLYRSNT